MRKAALCLTAAATIVMSLLVGAPAASAASCMQFSRIQYDTPGSDLPVTNKKLNAEWVSIHNTCSRKITMTHWQLRDRNGHIYVFPRTKVSGKKTITVHTGSGTQNPANRYWGSRYYIWNNTGDRARLWNGKVRVDQCGWGDGSGTKTC